MNKKLLTFLWMYIWWVITTLVYNKKTPWEIQKEFNEAKISWDKSVKVILHNFIEIHENLFKSLKDSLLSCKNKDLFLEKKDELVSLIVDFKLKSEKIIEEYKALWKDYAREWIEKLDKFYHEKLGELEKIKNNAPEKIEEVKSKIKSYYQELKDTIKK